MRTIRIGHRPNVDDAFMFSALTTGRVTIADVSIEHDLGDIESLNRRARAAELDLEVTAVSAATYTLVADRYRLLDAGASMSTGHGPVLVARELIDVREISDRVVAIPGSHTTACLLLRLYTREEPALIEVAFDRIPEAVLEGQADLGLLIHECRITYPAMGLVGILDLGDAWQRDTGLPLPLGVYVVRRDVDEDLQREISRALRESIAWARANVDEALADARRRSGEPTLQRLVGGGGEARSGEPTLQRLDDDSCRRFVLASVNDSSVSLGSEGRAALERLYVEAHRRGLIPAAPPIDPI